jgi:hypothetical protein
MSPSKYQPNPVDDRALTTDAQRETYRAMTAAIEECETLIEGGALPGLGKGVLRGVITAEAALRRAAFALVLNA